MVRLQLFYIYIYCLIDLDLDGCAHKLRLWYRGSYFLFSLFFY